MQLGSRARAIVAAVACAAVLCADQVAGIAQGAEPAPTPPAPGCLQLTGMSEKIIDGSIRDLGGPYLSSVGGSSTYLDHLYDASGAEVATVYGKANVPMKLDNGDVIEYSDERIEFADGVLEAAGFYNITQAGRGEWQFLPAIGVSGRYRDLLGKRHFRITKLGESLSGWIELCPAGTAR
ncbi:allene oxide cyclase barrel-like domain-containing protein [Amycolatopsis pithecellobii]|uniref:Allene oxide cyclase barrel-like domain-containing protein n=1 Tax=Amycolatopsis pithecellobii TaxID=664692 RepID=A0A6N7ZB01_9PSEU|nr:hypothetical protein [Amycolatopsis pithecellobii]MTD58855.1 hypothetical protein [Amycolatopsis pithecellobii]